MAALWCGARVLSGPIRGGGNKRIDLRLRTAPVLGGEGAKCEVRQTDLETMIRELKHSLDAAPVSFGSGQPSRFSPATVAVRDDGDVAREIGSIENRVHLQLLVVQLSIGLQPFDVKDSNCVLATLDHVQIARFRFKTVDSP